MEETPEHASISDIPEATPIVPTPAMPTPVTPVSPVQTPQTRSESWHFCNVPSDYGRKRRKKFSNEDPAYEYTL